MKLNRKQWFAVACALLLLAALKAALIWHDWPGSHRAAPVAVSCSAGRCPLPGGAELVFVDAPRHSRPFQLRLDGVVDTEPAVEFEMAGMDMGFNRYRFVRAGSAWQAKVTLPLCVTGSRDWLATVKLGEARYRVAFRVE